MDDWLQLGELILPCRRQAGSYSLGVGGLPAKGFLGPNPCLQ